MHLGALISLYVTLYALLDLIFSIINYLLPDQISMYLSASSVAWPISTLITLIPCLYVLEYFIVRDFKLTPEKKDLWVSKWRSYLTLFLTGLTIVISIISLLNTYLGGEITSRFIYKAIAVMLVSGSVFKYYFFRINDKYKISRFVRLANAGFMLIITIASIITGFILVGSPAEQRKLRFDERRVNDLTSIQYQVINFWQLKSRLPTKLTELIDPTYANNLSLIDPETTNFYEYIIVDNNSFKLCANFSLKTDKSNGNRYFDATWVHGAGRFCFDRTIDPEKYPPFNKK